MFMRLLPVSIRNLKQLREALISRRWFETRSQVHLRGRVVVTQSVLKTVVCETVEQGWIWLRRVPAKWAAQEQLPSSVRNPMSTSHPAIAATGAMQLELTQTQTG